METVLILTNLDNGKPACAPGLAAYRYILVEDEIVIVDPIDYAIAAVVSG